MKTPNIFISHRWAYKEDYYDLVNMLNKKLWKYSDYSVPEHDPYDLNKIRQIENQLKEQVRQCNFFIVSARMASKNSRWIEKEVQFANEYGKYILSVIPRGYFGNIPIFIQKYENERFYLSDMKNIINLIEKQLS